MLNKPLYSIIIPHYNLPKLLRRCLQSIPEREDVQVIVVDDSAQPHTVAVFHEVAYSPESAVMVAEALPLTCA